MNLLNITNDAARVQWGQTTGVWKQIELFSVIKEIKYWQICSPDTEFKINLFEPTVRKQVFYFTCDVSLCTNQPFPADLSSFLHPPLNFFLSFPSFLHFPPLHFMPLFHPPPLLFPLTPPRSCSLSPPQREWVSVWLSGEERWVLPSQILFQRNSSSEKHVCLYRANAGLLLQFHKQAQERTAHGDKCESQNQ